MSRIRARIGGGRAARRRDARSRWKRDSPAPFLGSLATATLTPLRQELAVLDKLDNLLHRGLETHEAVATLLRRLGLVNGARVRRRQLRHQPLRFPRGRLDRSRGRLDLLHRPRDLPLDDLHEPRVVLGVRLPAGDFLQDVRDGRCVRVLRPNGTALFRKVESESRGSFSASIAFTRATTALSDSSLS